MKHIYILVSALGLGALLQLSLATAASTDGGTLPRYACSFSSGGSWTEESGKFEASSGAPLAFEISSISRKERSAELTTKTGRTDLKLVAAIDALHFIEVTVSGYLTLTTIYGDGKRVPAVHSRHLGIVGQPVGGQLTGFCERT